MKNQRKAYFLALTTIFFWSTVATVTKLSLAHATPDLLVFYATWISWLVLGIALVMQRKVSLVKTLGKKEWFASLIFGGINPVIYYLLLFKAYDILPAQQCQVINYTWAITMTLLSIPLLKQKVKGVQWVAIALSYFGVLVIATKGHPLSLHFENPLGVFLALASTVLWAIYWILNTRDTRDPVVGLFANFCCALPLISIYYLFSEGVSGIICGGWQGVAGGIYLGLFEMGLSYLMWLGAMKYTENTARIAVLIFVAPILSLVFIAFLLKEPIHPSTIAGLVLVLAGLGVQKLKER